MNEWHSGVVHAFKARGLGFESTLGPRGYSFFYITPSMGSNLPVTPLNKEKENKTAKLLK